MTLHRVVNSWALILIDQKAGKHYLRALGRWFEAATLDGPWAVAVRPNAALDAAMQSVAEKPAGEPPRRPRRRGEGGGGARRGSRHPRQHGARRADPDARPARLRAHRGHRPPARRELVREHRARPGGPAPLRPPVRAVVPERVLDRRPLGVRRARQAPRRVRPHPGELTPGARFWPRSRARRRRKEALIDNSIPQTAAVNRTTTTYQATYDGTPKFQPIEGTPLHHAVNSPVPVIQVAPNLVLLAEGRGLVHGDRGHGAVDRGHVGAGRDLHDPVQLPLALRDLRPRVRRHAPDGVRRLHARLLRDGGRSDQRRRLRHRLRLSAGLRGRVLVPAAPDLRVRRRLRMGRGDGLRLRGGDGRRLGRCLGLLPPTTTSTSTGR